MLVKILKYIKTFNFKTIINISLIFFIPFLLIILSIFNYTYTLEKENTIDLIIEEKEERANTIESLVTYIKNGVIVDLLVIKEAQEFQDYINNPTEENQISSEQLFLRIASNKQNFISIVYIDNNGKEDIKINHNLNNIEIVDKESLLDQSETDYFNYSKQIETNKFYFSSMDLLINNGENYNSNSPIIRICNPIYNDKNEFVGILDINFDATEILNICDNQFEKISFDFVDLSLVNSNGFYLYNKDVEKRFSFKFEDKNYNINNDSKLFNENKDKSLDYYIEDNKVFTINKLDYRKIYNAEYTSSLYLVSSFEIEDIPIVKESLFYFLSLYQIIIILIAYIFFFICGVVIYTFQKNSHRLALITTISNVMSESILITDYNFNVVYVNGSFLKMSGYNESEMLSNLTDFLNFSIQDKKIIKQIKLSIKELGLWEGKLWYKTKDGILLPKLLKIYSYSNRISSHDNYIFTYTPLKKEEELNLEIDNDTNFNETTMLPNEKLLLELINNSIQNKVSLMGLFCFSIINYEEIFLSTNLEDKNTIINSSLSDIKSFLGESDIIAQISKYSFVIVLLSYNNIKEIQDFVKHFFIYNKNKYPFEKIDVPFELKGGLSIYPKDNLTAKELLNNSYIALSEARKSNKDYIAFSRELNENINKRIQFSSLLRNAITNNELYVQYQPQIDIKNNKIIGMEALMRWKNKELGLVSPYYFIPVAEKNGFIIKLGYWIIEQVFIDYNKIKDILPINFKLSINISPIQFNDKLLINKIVILSNKYSIDLSKFEIEITENIFLENKNLINEKIGQFRKLGVSIAIDDFGTGFSSLSYLKDLSVDKIKIDRSFIYEYPEKDNGTIAKIVINICKELNLKVISEGVEEKSQVDYLNSLGCRYIQGYYYSKPLSMDDLIEFIKNHN